MNSDTSGSSRNRYFVGNHNDQDLSNSCKWKKPCSKKKKRKWLAQMKMSSTVHPYSVNASMSIGHFSSHFCFLFSVASPCGALCLLHRRSCESPKHWWETQTEVLWSKPMNVSARHWREYGARCKEQTPSSSTCRRKQMNFNTQTSPIAPARHDCQVK